MAAYLLRRIGRGRRRQRNPLSRAKFDTVLAFRCLLVMGYVQADTIKLGSGLLRLILLEFNLTFVDSLRKSVDPAKES